MCRQGCLIDFSKIYQHTPKHTAQSLDISLSPTPRPKLLPLRQRMDSQTSYSSHFENYNAFSASASSLHSVPEVILANLDADLHADSSPFDMHGSGAQPATISFFYVGALR